MALNFLIVDDSKILRGMVRRILGMTGIAIGDVHEAGSGKEALEVLGQHKVDVVLADLNMPEMSGTELVERIRKNPVLGSTHVIIISSERASATVENPKNLGVHAYLTKPFRAESLRDVLSTLPGNIAGVPHAN